MTQSLFNERLRQVIILATILLLGIAMFREMNLFLPGILGAITFYILARKTFFRLVYKKKWKPSVTALLFMLGFLVIVAIPIYFSITLVTPKIQSILENPTEILENVKGVASKIENATGIKIIKPDTLEKATNTITQQIPKLLNSTANILTNLIMMFFLLYYLLVNGSVIERSLGKWIPLKQENINMLASETRVMVKANALGIPIICIVQGLTAAVGYWIFGVKDWAMWGFVTGVFAFFPIVGTMIIWVPIVISMFAQGDNNTMAIGLTLYSVIVTGNVDYLARMTLMKKMGDVHPVITVLGVIVGLGLFGFIGLVFGPLLISYFIVLVKIYMNEFADKHAIPPELRTDKEKLEAETAEAKSKAAEVEKSIDNLSSTAQEIIEKKDNQDE